MKFKITVFIGSLMMLTMFNACKETLSPPEQSNSKIVSYTIPVYDGELSGIIDESDKTITVYLPFYYQLDVIDPIIKLATGASILEELLPIDVLDDKTIYTVTGADKSVTVYKLIIKIQQISPLVINELSTGASPSEVAIGSGGLVISGNFNTADPTKIKAFLVGEDNVETALTPSVVYTSHGITINVNSDGTKNYVLSYLAIPPSMEPGSYKLKVKIQSLMAMNVNPIQLVIGRPSINYLPVTVKQGETFTIKTSGSIFVNFTEFSILVNGTKVICPIISYDRTSATIRLPESVPPGSYAPTAQFEQFSNVPTYWNITVQAK
ncbi:hypothetical protein ACSBL2_15275 [Pedobacter sp. AW31-3R]|uniref:hypothetical protein n=1 Tax=Pedobacter sp. AW31-3R TaxID=3445781 RepID=UPI003F9FBDCD